jgi:ribonuclease VapC
MESADRCVLSAVNAHETATVLRLRYGAHGAERLWELVRDNDIEIVPFDERQERAAAAAFDRYAAANVQPSFGIDAFSAAYALAKLLSAPLLFKGNDFAQTDAQRCV